MKEDKAKIDYETHEDFDGIGEGNSPIPTGWKLYYWGTIVWMVYYVYAYTPLFTGWTQSQGLD